MSKKDVIFLYNLVCIFNIKKVFILILQIYFHVIYRIICMFNYHLKKIDKIRLLLVKIVTE